MLTVNFNPFPLLSTGRLLLRKVIKEDASEIFFLRSHKSVMEFLDRPVAKSIEDAHQLIRKIDDSLIANEGITWAITLKNRSALIGTIGFWKITKEHYRAEIGYLLHPRFQGKGMMQEAFTAVLDYGFKVMYLHSVEANVNPGNLASIKLLEKNNFTREAYFKENYFYGGKFLDSAIYSLLTPTR
jgi:RimJ/RimL family protein N-acetyltransferase